MAERYAIAESPSGVGIIAAENYLLISNGDGTWRTGPGGGGGGAVDSVFGRTGVVEATTGDYSSNQVTNDSAVAGGTVTDALNNLRTSVNSKVTSVFGRTGVVVAVTGDYAASQVTNDSGVAGTTVKIALDALNAKSGVVSVFGRTGVVVAVAGDYNATQVTNTASVAGATVRDALNTLSQSNGIHNQSNVTGTTVSDALNTLNRWILDYHGIGAFAAGTTDLTDNPLAEGLYMVTAACTTLTTNTTGTFTTSFSCHDQSGLVTKLALTNDSGNIATQAAQVYLVSDGTTPIKWITAITVAFVGGNVNVSNKLSICRLVTG